MAAGRRPVWHGRMPATAVLVEGHSDRTALESLARRRRLDLAGAGVLVVALGGITNLPAALRRWAPTGGGRRVVGLYDAPEEHVVRRGLEREGLIGPHHADLTTVGFHGCVPDLEAELIRAVGVPGVEAIIAARGELRALRTLQTQSSWVSRRPEDQIRRFLGNAGRKAGYAPFLVDALDLQRVPAPLDRVLLDAVGPDRSAPCG